MPTLLIVDDERNVRYSLQRSFAADDVDVITAASGQEGLALLADQLPDAVILDVRLPDQSGLDVFDRMRQIEPRLPVIIITAHTTTEIAIEAMKRGAFEYLLKPYNLGELRTAVHKAFELSRLSRVPAVFDQAAVGAEGDDICVDRIVGTSPAMQDVYKEIGRVASQDVTVLILGESGTGKELVARAIYQHSRRQDAPFVAINCAAIPETLLESELFGHEKGAFTGAEHRRIGKFEQAHGGTIFLDEIGDMSPATQARVLRVLQDGRFERVGGNDIVESDARVIAATNRDLEAAIGNREFRQDLFYRLNVFTIRLPPLRDRMVDLPRLVDHFRNRFNHDLKADVQSIAEPAMKLLRDYDWPGNIRELQSAVKYAVVRATGDVITADCLPAAVRGESSDHPLTADDSEALSIRNFVRSLLADGHGEVNDRVRSTVDRMVIQEVLNFVGGHQTRAAELLGISPTTLRARMQQLGLTLEKTVKPEDASPGPPKYP